MKKLLLTLFVAVLSLPVLGQLISPYDYTFSGSESSSISGKETATLTLDGISWNYTYTKSSTSSLSVQKDGPGRGLQFGSKGKMPEAITFETTAFSGKIITAIECQIGGDGGTYTYSIDNSDLEDAANKTYSSASGTSTVSAKWEGSANCNSSLSLKIMPVQGSSKKALFLKSISVTFTDGGSVDPDPAEPGLYWPKDEYTVEYGKAFESPSLIFSPAEFANETILYDSSDLNVATIDDNGEVTIVGVGTTTISALGNWDGVDYMPAYTLTVTPIIPVLTWSADEYTVTLGKEDEATYPTLTVQPEEAEALVEYSSSNEDVAMIDENTGVIVPMGAGTTVITATINEYDNYAGATKSYTLTVREAGSVDPTPESGTVEIVATTLGLSSSYAAFEYTDQASGLKFEGYANLQSSAIGLAKNGGYLLLTANPNSLKITKVAFTAKTASSKATTLTVNANSTNYTSTKGQTISSLAGTSVLNASMTQNSDQDFSADINNLFFGMRNSTSTGQVVISKITVYYESVGDPTKEPAGLSFGETTTFDVMQGAEFTAPKLQNPNELEVVYASDNEAVAKVDPATGVVTIVGAGTATITAASEETDTYNAGSASYTITVKAAAKTLAEYIAMAAENNATAIMNCELIVTYANGAYVFVTDEHHTAYSLIYKYGLGDTYTKGNVIPAGWNAKTTIYRGLFEIEPVGDMPASVKTAEIGYETVDEFGLADINRVINLENVTVEGESFMTEAGQSFKIFNRFNQPTLSSGTYHMTGVVSYHEPNVTSTDNLKVDNLQFHPIEYRLTADKAATMKVSHASADQKDNDDLYEAIDGEMHNANGSHVFVKFFNIPEGHTVYYRFVNEPAAANVMPLADEAEPAFVEYTGEPVEYNTNGSLEYYTQNAEGVKTEVKSISFSGVTGIEDVVVDGVDAEAVYYTLQGVRVERPAKGNVYVRVAGNKAVKVLVK